MDERIPVKRVAAMAREFAKFVDIADDELLLNGRSGRIEVLLINIW
jgi:hypothetical protein